MCRESSKLQFQVGCSLHRQQLRAQLQEHRQEQLMVKLLFVNTPGNSRDEPQLEAAGSLQGILSPL